MTLNKFLFFLLIFNLFSCKKESLIQDNSKILLTEIQNIVDSISLNSPNSYNDYLYTITHQRKGNEDFIKIATSEYFNKDSVYTYELYNNRLLIFYSKDFFKEKPLKTDTIGLENYVNLMYNKETVSIYLPKWEIFKIINNNRLKRVSKNEINKKELFNFGDRYISEPQPNDL